MFRFDASGVGVALEGGYAVVSLEEGRMPEWKPGWPMLPARYVNVLLPEGHVFAGLDVRAADRQLLAEGVLVHPAQRPSRPGVSAPAFAGPDAEVYGRMEAVPGAWAEVVRVQSMRGRRFVTVRLNPLRYHPASRELFLAGEIEVVVRHEAEARRRGEGDGLSLSPRFAGWLDSVVVNPERGRRAVVRRGEDAVEYLIITSRELAEAFEELAAYRADRFVTRVVRVEDIYAAFEGRDEPEQIRSFLQEFVAEHGTDYVVLGGDDTVVPVRYVEVTVDEQTTAIPTDLYYGGLEGDWDANENDAFGELLGEEGEEVVDEADMAFDVIVSRIPVRTVGDVENYVGKVMAFEAGEWADVHGRLFLSGAKGWHLIYGDSRGTDEVFDSYPSFRSHQPVSDAEHWVRRVHRDFIQPYWSASVLDVFFDTFTSWDETFAGDFTQTAERFVEVYNQGWEHQFFDTHGNPQSYSLEQGGEFTVEDVGQITNLTAFITTTACLTGHFDGEEDPSVAEAFIRSETGALVYHGCSRYGWGMHYPLHYYGGASSEYANEYLKLLLGGESEEVGKAQTVGEAHAKGKLALSGVSGEQGMHRWLQFGLNLFGDPAIEPRPNDLPAVPRLEGVGNVREPEEPGIRVGFGEVEGASGYEVERRAVEEDAWAIVGAVEESPFVDETASAGVFYLYRVRAINEHGHSIWSVPAGVFAGELARDAWDPGDDTPEGATLLEDFETFYQAHGPHTLSASDTNDWFTFDVLARHSYQFSGVSVNNRGGLYARVYDADMNVVAEGGDLLGDGQFALFVEADRNGRWFLQVEPNENRDSAAYSLFYRVGEGRSEPRVLADALDAPELEWRTSTAGVNPWFAQPDEKVIGSAAVQSGAIFQPTDADAPAGGYSWIETSFEIETPAFMFFLYRTELPAGVRLLGLLNGRARLELESDEWDRKRLALLEFPDPTLVELRFELVAPDDVDPAGARAWLDQFVLITEGDMFELEPGIPFEEELAYPGTHVYGTELEEPGHFRVDIVAEGDTALDWFLHDQAGDVVLAGDTDGPPPRWTSEEEEAVYFLVIEHFEEGEAIAYSVTLGDYEPQTYYVDAASESPVAPYTSWETAARIIQDAVDWAIPGEEVIVRAGMYDAGGRASDEGGVPSRVFIDKAITVRSEDGPEETVIVGEGPIGESAVRGVFIQHGTLRGFTIAGGHTWSEGGVNMVGGGVLIKENATVEDCIIAENAAQAEGGGVFMDSGTLLDSLIAANEVPDGLGGGISVSRSGEIRGSRIEYNVARQGGGVYLEDGGEVVNSHIVRNHATESAGGVLVVDEGVFINCEIAFNTAVVKGGGVALVGNQARLINCTVTRNESEGAPGGAVLRSGALAVNSIIYGNLGGGEPAEYEADEDVRFLFSCTRPEHVGDFQNSITNDPLFVGDEDFRLQEASPCINNGIFLDWMEGHDDLAGEPRILRGAVDMGAYESPYWGMHSDIDGDGFTDWVEVHVLGTDPEDADSFLGMVGVPHPAAAEGGLVVRWQSVDGVKYNVLRSTNLLDAPPFVPWLSVTGAPTPAAYTTVVDTHATGPGPYFYQVEVEREE